MSKIAHFLFKDNYSRAAFALFVVGVFFRLYRLGAFVTFLGDQGRDAIIVKKILTLEHLPAIGAPTSVGQIYLGPFYYYFIAPWLLLFNFEPIGLAFGVAFFSSLFILVFYHLIKKIFDPMTALISAFFITFSSVLVEYSRFSWNPNLLPLFSLLFIYALFLGLKTSKKLYFLLSGMFLSFVIQLHYLGVLFMLPLFFVVVKNIIGRRKEIKHCFVRWGICIVSFLFFSAPLAIFDMRHQFLNAKSFLKLFEGGGGIQDSKLDSLAETVRLLHLYAIGVPMSFFLSILTFIAMIILVVLMRKNAARFFLFFLIFLIIGFSFYAGPKFPHYYGVFYPFYYVVIAYCIAYLYRFRAGKIIAVVFLLTFLFIQRKGYGFLTGKGSYQVETAKKISKIIYENVTKNKYTTTALPHKYSDSTYRYFLELWEKKPIEKDSLERADELFVVCEVACTPVGDPQWDIAYFAPRLIVGEWREGNITIYKLIR